MSTVRIRLTGQLANIFGEESDELIIVGTINEGAIATHKRLDAFRDSLAHLMEDGRIMRYHVQIGTRADIEVLPDDVPER